MRSRGGAAGPTVPTRIEILRSSRRADRAKWQQEWDETRDEPLWRRYFLTERRGMRRQWDSKNTNIEHLGLIIGWSLSIAYQLMILLAVVKCCKWIFGFMLAKLLLKLAAAGVLMLVILTGPREFWRLCCIPAEEHRRGYHAPPSTPALLAEDVAFLGDLMFPTRSPGS